MTDEPGTTTSLGPNEWLVDEMYEQFLADPKSVSASWQEFFADYRRDQHEPAAPASAAPTTAAPAEAAAPAKGSGATASPEGTPLRGAAARIVANMEESLKVPTATSFR